MQPGDDNLAKPCVCDAICTSGGGDDNLAKPCVCDAICTSGGGGAVEVATVHKPTQ